MKPVLLDDLNSQLGKVNTFICAASFEDRCVSVANSIDLINIDLKVLCFNENEKLILNKNIDLLKVILSNPTELQFSSNDPIIIGDALFRFLSDKKNKELGHILIDTTTFTHEGLLIVIKFLQIYKNAYTKLTLAYVGASEYSLNEEKIENKWLTKGIKNIRSVLGFPGLLKPSKKNHLVVLFGFESERTKQLIEQFEFDKISLGFGSQSGSISSTHFKINIERHKELLKYHPAEQFEFSLTDPLETKNNIISHLKDSVDYNIVIAPMNTKLSTVGAALVSFEMPFVQLCYVQASEYNVYGYSKPSNECYIIEIEL